MQNHIKIISFLCLLNLNSTTSIAQVNIDAFKNSTPRGKISQSIKKSMWNALGGPFVAESIVESDDSDKFYWLFKMGSVGKFDVKNSVNIGGWGLFPSPQDCSSNQCMRSYDKVRWSKDEVIEPQVIDRYSDYSQSLQPTYNANVPTLGCLGDGPLKYGDIEGDGVSELVLYIENSWMIFSTTLNKVTFMTMLDVKDWLTEEQTKEHYGLHREEGAQLDPKDAQYQSKIATYVRGGDHSNANANVPGYRGYAKLYFGDFDANKKADIIVWRKLYESYLVQDSTKGFKKISDLMVHYERVDGEYKKQETESTRIADWLENAKLTWQAGYPSKSECGGQEGQLIPEMHDALLNDLDVLK